MVLRLVLTRQPEQTNPKEWSAKHDMTKRMSVPELDVNVPESNRYR